jgi:hypothetical protein
MSKSDEYKDVRWQKKRLETLERCNWTCQMCGGGNNDGVSLQVHHTRYPKDAPIWEVDDYYLTALCEGCHEEVTNLKADIGSILHMPGMIGTFRALTLLALDHLATAPAPSSFNPASEMLLHLVAINSISESNWRLVCHLTQQLKKEGAA